MTSSLTCHSCGTEQVVARGAVALNMTPEKLARIGRKLGWEIQWLKECHIDERPACIGKCLCPGCVVEINQEPL